MTQPLTLRSADPAACVCAEGGTRVAAHYCAQLVPLHSRMHIAIPAEQELVFQFPYNA